MTRAASTSTPTDARRSRILALLAALVLALLVSLATFTGTGGCTSAVALDRPTEDAPVARGASAVERTPVSALSDARSTRSSAADVLGSVRGFVVDATTGESVPHVEVELALGPHVERVAVGGDGTFASNAVFPTGIVVATVRDTDIVVGSASIEHTAEEGTKDWRVAVPIGPTIPFASIGDGAIRAEAWRARIVESALAADVVAEIDVGRGESALRAPTERLPDRAWTWRALRAGNPPWIRYPTREHAPVAGVTPELEVRDDAAQKKGSTMLRGTVGVHTAVSVETRGYAKARVRIARSAADERNAMRAVLWDTRDLPLDGGPGAPVFDERVVGANGEVEFDDLEGGTKRLVAWSSAERVDAPFVVEERPSRVVDVRARRVQLDARPSAWTGYREPDGGALIHRLVSVAAAGGRTRSIRWSTNDPEDDESERFQHAYGSVDGIAFRSVLASPLVPRRGREVGRVRCRFDFDPEPAHATIAFGPAGTYVPSVESDHDSALVLPDLEQPLAWSAWSHGLQPVFGDERSFVRTADGTHVARVEMQPGWGMQLVLRAADPDDESLLHPKELASRARTRERERGSKPSRDDAPRISVLLATPPVPGVVLFVDGLPAGTSDAGGELRVAQRDVPTRLQLVGRGWRATRMQKLAGASQRYVVWLQRRP